MSNPVLAHIDSTIAGLKRKLEGYEQARELIANSHDDATLQESPELIEEAARRTRSGGGRKRPASRSSSKAKASTKSDPPAEPAKSTTRSRAKSAKGAAKSTTTTRAKASSKGGTSKADRIRARLTKGEEPVDIAKAEGVEPAYVYYVRRRMPEQAAA